MEKKTWFLTLGLGLSIASKFLQWQFGSAWGDVLIIPAAIFLVLALLLYLPVFNHFLNNPSTRKRARLLAGFCCLAVVSFQFFTMFVFGRGMNEGWFFLLLVLLFSIGGFATWKSLTQTTNP